MRRRIVHCVALVYTKRIFGLELIIINFVIIILKIIIVDALYKKNKLYSFWY